MKEEDEIIKYLNLAFETNNEKKAYLDGYEDALCWIERMKKEVKNDENDRFLSKEDLDA